MLPNVLFRQLVPLAWNIVMLDSQHVQWDSSNGPECSRTSSINRRGHVCPLFQSLHWLTLAACSVQGSDTWLQSGHFYLLLSTWTPLSRSTVTVAHCALPVPIFSGADTTPHKISIFELCRQRWWKDAQPPHSQYSRSWTLPHFFVLLKNSPT